MLDDRTDDDYEPEGEEELFRNPVYYEPAQRNLNLDREDLGVPEEPGLLNKLLHMRGRVPVDKRGLICPDCMQLRNVRVSMFLVGRGGQWFGSHYRKPGEKPVSHESDEHITRKVLVAEKWSEAGHDVRVEQVVAGGRARLDVGAIGAGGRLLDYEPQLSEQSRRSILSRDAHRKDAGFTRIWDFVNADHPGIGAVPYVRTPDLPAPVIRAQKGAIEIRDGNYVVQDGWCTPEGTFVRCPEKPYDSEKPHDVYCGQHHLVVVPEHQASTAYESNKPTITLPRFAVEVADGERVPFKLNGQHGFIRTVQYERYLSEHGAEPKPKRARPVIRDADRRDLCTEDRPESDFRSPPRERYVSRTIILRSHDAETESPASAPATVSDQVQDPRPTDDSCSHWVGTELRYCRETQGVRRYQQGYRCVAHDVRTLAGLPPLPESPGIPAYKREAGK